MKLSSTLPLPALNGPGAAVAVSTMGGTKAVTVTGTFQGCTILVEASIDGVSYAPITSFQSPGGVQVVVVAAQFMRLVVSGRIQGSLVPFAASAQVTSNDTGGLFSTLAMPPWDGDGAVLDTSTFGVLSTVIVGGEFPGAVVRIQVSDAGVDWSDVIQFSGQGGSWTGDITATFVRVNVSGRRTTMPFTATAALGAINDAASGGGVITGLDIVNVLEYLVIGRTPGVTDDRAGIITAMAVAMSATENTILFFPPGDYLVSQSVPIDGARALRVWSQGANIRYPSHDLSLANSIERSAFHLTYCTDVLFEGVTFVGDQTPSYVSGSQGSGSGVYASHCVNITLQDCNALYGKSLAFQESQSPTTSHNVSPTSNVISVTSGIVTHQDPIARFVPGHVGRFITIANATNKANNGTFRILSYVSTTTITYANAAGVAESSQIRWQIDDNDRGLQVRGGRSFGCRANIAPSNDSVIFGHTFQHPNVPDIVGIGGEFLLSGTTVTLRTRHLTVSSLVVGRYVRILGATSAGNNGVYLITGFIPGNTYTPHQITWTNASGVAELYTGNWFVVGGEKGGRGAGVGALSQSGTGPYTYTLTSAEPVFAPDDIHKALIITESGLSGNHFNYEITTYISPTQVSFESGDTLSSSDYDKIFAVDGFDRVGNYGASHPIYVFAGRRNIKIIGCTFIDCRTENVKASGSTDPISDVVVENCTFIRAGQAAVWGADDSQEHTNLAFINNTLIDCCTQRYWGSPAVVVLGARNVQINGNRFHFTQNNYYSKDGGTPTGSGGILVQRYAAGGRGQPLEDVQILNNKFTCDPDNTSQDCIYHVPIQATDVGQRAYWSSSFSLAKNGNTMTLTAGNGKFSSQLTNRSIEIVFANDVGNNGTFVIETVTSASALTFTNAAGVAAASGSTGTYRISPKAAHKEGGCRIEGNEIHIPITIGGITLENCLAPNIRGNIFTRGGLIIEKGSVQPNIVDNEWHGAPSVTSATIRLNPSSWPCIKGNRAVNTNFLSQSITARDAYIGINTTIVDYPLLGYSGRAMSSDGYEQVVFAYGTILVDGDRLVVNGTTLTHKTTAPGANQFNSAATLIAAINGLAGVVAEDYGTPWGLTTNHIKIRRDVRSTSDAGTLNIGSATLNPTALVTVRNHDGTTSAMWGRGAASAGPIPDKFVAWTPLAPYTSTVMLAAGNAVGRTLLGGGSLQLRNIEDSGACVLVQTDRTDDGALTDLGAEIRWAMPS